MVFLVLGVSAIPLYARETMLRPVDGVLSRLEWKYGSQYMMLSNMGGVPKRSAHVGTWSGLTYKSCLSTQGLLSNRHAYNYNRLAPRVWE